jgi:hypothetical protein
MQTPESGQAALANRDLATSDGSGKAEARLFLQAMESFLATELPTRSEVRAAVDEEVARARAAKQKSPDKNQSYISSPEGAFFKLLGIGCVFRFLVEKAAMPEDEARTALLSESFRNCRNFSSNSPRSKEKHPFTKNVGENIRKIVARWWDKDEKSAVQQSCPDLALRPPCRHRIVIEGKYFRKGGYEFAQSELVKDIYQCFYYRGLPRIPATKAHPEWNYDYACLLAYDASEEGNLKTAWARANKKVVDGLWDGANIHVMVVRSKN